MYISTSNIHCKLKQEFSLSLPPLPLSPLLSLSLALCLDPRGHYSASEVENKSVLLNNEASLQGATAGLSLQRCSLLQIVPTFAPPHPVSPSTLLAVFPYCFDSVFKWLWESFYCHGWRRHEITISVTNDSLKERRQLDLCHRSWGTANVLGTMYDCVPPRPVSVCRWQAVNARQQERSFVFYPFLQLQNVSTYPISPSQLPNVDFDFVKAQH